VRVEDVFFSDSMQRSHTGGWSWRVECVTLSAFRRRGGFNESALGETATKWGARRKIRHWRRRFLLEALSTAGGEG
jgi:hypothetical protein